MSINEILNRIEDNGFEIVDIKSMKSNTKVVGLTFFLKYSPILVDSLKLNS